MIGMEAEVVRVERPGPVDSLTGLATSSIFRSVPRALQAGPALSRPQAAAAGMRSHPQLPLDLACYACQPPRDVCR
jgi:hypothetical protein